MTFYPKRGEIYLAQMDKLRPVIVLSVDSLNKYALDVCVVSITSKEHSKYSMRVPIKAGYGGLEKNCWAKCDQVATIQKSLLQYPAIGTLPPSIFSLIEEQVKISLGLL